MGLGASEDRRRSSFNDQCRNEVLPLSAGIHRRALTQAVEGRRMDPRDGVGHADCVLHIDDNKDKRGVQLVLRHAPHCNGSMRWRLFALILRQLFLFVPVISSCSSSSIRGDVTRFHVLKPEQHRENTLGERTTRAPLEMIKKGRFLLTLV